MTKSNSLYGVYGASGYGREVMPIARDQLRRVGVDTERLVFIDDKPGPERVNGQRLLGFNQFLDEPADEKFVVLAISNGRIRETLAERCRIAGVSPWTVIASNSIQLDAVELGEGAVLSPFVALTSNLRIGRCFHANIYSYVAHDCVIGDYVTFAPSVQCNGNVVVEDHAYIGTAAVLKQGQPGAPLIIGKGSVVGMGAVVTKNVPPGVTVVGNPARSMQKT